MLEWVNNNITEQKWLEDNDKLLANHDIQIAIEWARRKVSEELKKRGLV